MSDSRPGERLLDALKRDSDQEPTRLENKPSTIVQPPPSVRTLDGPTLGGNSRAGFTASQMAAHAAAREEQARQAAEDPTGPQKTFADILLEKARQEQQQKRQLVNENEPAIGLPQGPARRMLESWGLDLD